MTVEGHSLYCRRTSVTSQDEHVHQLVPPAAQNFWCLFNKMRAARNYGVPTSVVARGSTVPRWSPLIGVLAVASIAAVMIISVKSSTTELETLPWNFQYPAYQQLVQTQPSLMDEGSIQMDPSKVTDAAKEFFRQNEESTETDEDVPDAGPGHMLGGWTHPELVTPPNPMDLQSFQTPATHSAVYSPEDYLRTPGAVETVESARGNIASLQQNIATAHQEAEEAKSVYEREEAKTKTLEGEYVKYLQRYGRARNHNWSYYKDSKKSVNMWAQPTAGQNFAQNNQAQVPQSGQDQKPDYNFVVDPKIGDAAAQYRKQYYEQSTSAQPSLYQVPRVFQQSLAAYPTEAAVPTQQERQRENMLETEEQAIRDRSVKVRLAQDVARLQLARKRLASVIGRPTSFQAKPIHIREFCPEGTPGCGASSGLSMTDYNASPITVGGQSEEAMRTAGDREVPMRQARQQQPHWIGDAFMQ